MDAGRAFADHPAGVPSLVTFAVHRSCVERTFQSRRPTDALQAWVSGSTTSSTGSTPPQLDGALQRTSSSARLSSSPLNVPCVSGAKRRFMHDEYTADQIELLDGVESIRRRAAMYVGRLDSPHLTTRLLMQALCHALDCAVDGHCTDISIEVAERSARVRYDAALPLARTPQGMIAAEVMLTLPAACSSMKKNLRVGDKYCSLGMAWR